MIYLLLKFYLWYWQYKLQYLINHGPEWNMEFSIPIQTPYRHFEFRSIAVLNTRGGGVLPCLTWRDVPLNRVSFMRQGLLFLYKLCDRVLQLIRKLCDRVSCGSTPFRVIMKQRILAKLLSDRVYFWEIFYATGYRVLSDLPHTPVTSLVKYPPPRVWI